jgi:hypothetical protein
MSSRTRAASASVTSTKWICKECRVTSAFGSRPRVRRTYLQLVVSSAVPEKRAVGHEDLLDAPRPEEPVVRRGGEVVRRAVRLHLVGDPLGGAVGHRDPLRATRLKRQQGLWAERHCRGRHVRDPGIPGIHPTTVEHERTRSRGSNRKHPHSGWAIWRSGLQNYTTVSATFSKGTDRQIPKPTHPFRQLKSSTGLKPTKS